MSKHKLIFAFLLMCLSAAAFAQQDMAEQAYELEDTVLSAQNDAQDGEFFSEEDDEQDSYSNFTLAEGAELARSEVSKAYQQEIESVLTGDDFAQKETVTRWRWKNISDKKERDAKFPEWLISIFEVLERNEETVVSVSKGFEVLLWALLIGVIIFVIVRYRQQLSSFVQNLGAEAEEPELPTSLFGLDIKKKNIPEDVVASAKQLWSEGQPREALVVLLTASLVKLLRTHHCQFYDSDTEAECCDRIDQQVPEPLSVYMRKLVKAWQLLAYAHMNPAEQEFEQLCQQWREVF